MKKGRTRTRMDWKNFKGTGVQAVDMCAATILAHRIKSHPIKAIHLQKKLYDQFKMWLERQMERELQPGEGLQFDDVNIDLGDGAQRTPLLVELYAK